MKSYLSLIPISARVHRRQNRMTLLCIIFAVFMVTSIFSMAEMGTRMEQARLAEKHGVQSLEAVFNSSMGQSLLLIAGVLFLLVLAAGVLMISGSINSSVAQRTKFFGMLRCIGMSQQQIIRFVRLEALNWCKRAVPIGLGLGVGATWGLCGALRFLVGEEFSRIPLFGVSGIGVVSGMVVGVVTVWIAAQSPAKHAATVSPVAALSGSSENTKRVRHPKKARFLKIDGALGVHHAVAARKNLFLMTGSFALSIILFLSFSVLVDFVGCLVPQSAAASDMDIFGPIPVRFAETIRTMEGVKQVYGRRSRFDVPVTYANGTDAVDLISFDAFDLQALEKDGVLKRGSDLKKVYGDSSYVLATSDQDSPWKIGDRISMGGEELEIAGLLTCDPFSSDGLTHGKLTLIASGETFIRLTGVEDYDLLMVQMSRNAADADTAAIHGAADGLYKVRDHVSTAGTYIAFVACVYAFLAIIALITMLNIVNSISMSVSARVKQYGSMRAVGMDERQITNMIGAEAFTYALLGCGAGCIIGLPLSKLLYDTLITSHFQYARWSFPVVQLGMILSFVVLCAITAAYAPAKRMGKLSVTETIHDL